MVHILVEMLPQRLLLKLASIWGKAGQIITHSNDAGRRIIPKMNQLQKMP